MNSLSICAWAVAVSVWLWAASVHAETIFSPLWPDTIGDTEDPNFVGSPKLLKMRAQIKACAKPVDPCVRLAYDTIFVTSLQPLLRECKLSETEVDFQSFLKPLSPCYKKAQDAGNAALSTARQKCMDACNRCVQNLVGQQSDYPICAPTVSLRFEISSYDKSSKSFKLDLQNRMVTPGDERSLRGHELRRENETIKIPTH
ncbi:MAG: hypothetical protein KDD51_04055 [Bdellovibrionales bacterium]|nr:hypothetical protein [Bdellovibrionales bacterium]